jgi:hypothetical protein
VPKMLPFQQENVFIFEYQKPGFSPKNITVPLVTKKFSFASERREGGRGVRRVDSILLYNNSDQIQPPCY